MRDWGLLYQRQPVHLDAILLAAALALHAPLFMLHIRAPQKAARGEKANRLVNIDYIELKAKERKAKQALPPAVPDARKLEEAAKKMAEMRERLLKKAAPPPPAPKAELKPDLAAKIDATKIQPTLKERLEQQSQKLLQGGKSFTDKPGQLPSAGGPKEIKMGGGAGAIVMGAKPGALAGPVGKGLKGKGGFQMAKADAPMSIGGDEGGIKVGGPAAIVVPVGARARADAGILSPVASIKDKGSLQGKGAPGGAPGIAGGGGPGAIALGAGGGGPISVGGARAPSVPLPASTLSGGGKSFSERPPSAGTEAGGGARRAGEGLPVVDPIARRPQRQRPLFQITGPLKDRTVLEQPAPVYPDWALEKGITAMVTLQITVSPEGIVKSTILVLRTTGYPQLDELVMDTIRRWRFAPLPPDALRDEVGAVTMNFSLSR